MIGTIFDLKEFSVHDGPGARVTVFFKGCPLRCVWCHNPEGLRSEPELMIKTTLCQGCGQCRKPCNHKECEPFDRCIFACPKGLVSITGTKISAENLAVKLLKNADFLKSNGGGITLSGGEPLMQADFVLELLSYLKTVHIAIQTSGYASEEVFKKVINNVDFVMMDIKLANAEMHKKYTGVDNKLILKNFQYLKTSGKEYVIRIPLIPNITDTEENLNQISNIVGDSTVELLPYNTFAGAKYQMVGKRYLLKEEKQNEIDMSIFKNGRML